MNAMQIKDRFHITYCTNIHPGQNWQSTKESLERYLPEIRARVSEGADFGIGLRLSHTASKELGTGKQLKEFKEWLNARGLYVFTMNGFPYGNFHNERVKDRVHAPDWTTRERLDYTKRLFDQLAFLIPEGLAGGISTSPVSYKHWHATPALMEDALRQGAGHMAQLILHLHRIETTGGTYLHLDIEPEPDGLLENSREVVSFFQNHLEPAAIPFLCTELQLSEEAARRLVYRYVTVCYDICHFSLAYEAPEASFRLFREAGIAIGKIQVSAALKIRWEAGEEDIIWESLARFDEPTYLHQVTEKKGDTVVTYRDLPEVLANRKAYGELRAHFHVPVFLERFEHLYSTQDHILEVLQYLRNDPVTEQLEIETYTWEVLPPSLKKALPDSIVRELEWLKKQLEA